MNYDLQAEIIPLRKLPAGTDIFSYGIPQRLRTHVTAGSVVEIPFRNQIVYGVVKDIHSGDAATAKLKEVRSVSAIRLTDRQLEIASLLARRYYQSEALVIRQFVASPPKRGRASAQTFYRSSKLSLPRIAPKDVSREAYVIFQRYSDIASYLAEVVRRLKGQGQTLIIVPELRQLDFLASALEEKKIMARVLIVPPRQQKNAFFKAWSDSQTATVIIGTGRAIFMPFARLRQICLVEAEHGVFQQSEQNPRYHLADIIDSVATIYGAKLLLTGFSPNLALLARVEKSMAVRQLRSKKSDLELVDMRPERQTKNYRLLSERTQKLIAETPGAVLLLLNRLGRARTLLCLDCRSTALCLRCGHPLAVGASDTRLVCFICSNSQPMPLTCPQCHGTNIRWRGAGVTSLGIEIKELFPQRRLVEISATSEGTASITPGSIVVATNKIYSRWAKTFDLAVAVNPDVDLQLPRYQAAENLRAHLLKLAAASKRALIQTYVPEHYVYQTLTDIKAFYHRELQIRKDFGYPPYAVFIKILVRHHDKDEMQRRAALLLKHFKEFQPYGPFEKTTSATHQGYLIIKVARVNQRLDFLLRHSYNWMQTEINPFDIS